MCRITSEEKTKRVFRLIVQKYVRMCVGPTNVPLLLILGFSDKFGGWNTLHFCGFFRLGFCKLLEGPAFLFRPHSILRIQSRDFCLVRVYSLIVSLNLTTFLIFKNKFTKLPLTIHCQWSSFTHVSWQKSCYQ